MKIGLSLQQQLIKALSIFSLLIPLLILLALCVGNEFYTPLRLWELFSLYFSDREHPSPDLIILMQLRLPRSLLAILVGGALSLAGAVFQGLLRNPLADPYITGTSSGAALGVCVGVFLGVNMFSFLSFLPAFLGALSVTAIVYLCAGKGGKLSVSDFLIAGVITGTFCSAFITFLMSISGEDISKVIFWLMGTFSGREDWDIVLMLSVGTLPAAALLFFVSPKLNLLSLGEEAALSKGINPESIKKIAIISASFLTALSVSIAGTIGFIGFMVPHIMRFVFSSDHRVLLPVAFLGGGAFLLIADSAARIGFSGFELPAGVITALLGAPFFIFILRKSRG